MAEAFSTLEINILRAKGLTEGQIQALTEAGITSRNDFKTVGDVSTLLGLLPDLGEAKAQAVMEWGAGVPPTADAGKIVVESADAVYCIHCGTKQPKDYESGDLCISCGKQAEPILACYWCSSSGPGKYCRSCGAEFVPTGELDLAILLKREGLPKDEIPAKLRGLDQAGKDDLWGRVRRARG